ncbi:MAG: hypothetical protein KAI74_00335 [Kiritimatiellae bacterium]|nr:hypothetical protein [Kiritimatiellia bacterium]
MKYMVGMLVGLLCASMTVNAEDVVVPKAAKDILNSKSFWRYSVASDKHTYKENGIDVPVKVAKRVASAEVPVANPAPEAGWMKLGFDDSCWPRERMAYLGRYAFDRVTSEQISLRGKFNVTDVKTANLYFETKYIGGFVLYINGKEVGRVDLPKGELTSKSFATPYADSYYLDDKGVPFNKWKNVTRKSDGKKIPGQVYYGELRMDRKFSVKIPSTVLVAGVNVIAVELHRSAISLAAKTWSKFGKSGYVRSWSHLGLKGLRLANAGDGVVANIARPTGIQIWNVDINNRVDMNDYGDPNEKSQPVRIVAARNGSFIGQFVVSSDKKISNFKVTAEGLKAEKGTAVIGADKVDLLYADFDWKPRWNQLWALNLQKKAPESVPIVAVAAPRKENGAMKPVVVRINVAADVKAGVYSGKVLVVADGERFTVPVKLEVADWTLPDPVDFRTYVGLYESPTTVSMQYKVPMWSEEHWKLLEKSFELLGRAGNKFLNIDVVDETQYGNDDGYITWVKQADGSYTYDLSVMERLVELALKHWGQIDFIPLQIWHSAGGGGRGGWYFRPVDTKCTVRVKDAKTGNISHMQVPVFGTAEAIEFWKPVLLQIQQSLTKLGVEKGMCIGILGDSTAPVGVFETITAAYPGDKGAFWQRGLHNATSSKVPYEVERKVPGNKVILHEHCYGMKMVNYDIPTLPEMHTLRGQPAAAYFRISNFGNVATLMFYREMGKRALFTKKTGLSRICFDYWDVPDPNNPDRKPGDIYNRWLHSTCAQREPSLKRMSWPGVEGAETTTRFENLIVGIQEAEALIVLSEGAANEEKVGKKLADKCRSVMRRQLGFAHYNNIYSERHIMLHVNYYGWQDMSAELYAVAGEVAAKMGK